MKHFTIENLDNDIYHNSDKYKKYWSSSNIKQYLKTPREALFQKNEPNKQTDAMIFGSQIHDYFASYHIKGLPFSWNIFEPPTNAKGVAYKSGQKYNEAMEKVKNPITAEQLEQIQDIWEMARAHDNWYFFEQEILTKGVTELSFFWEENGAFFKVRYDVVTDNCIFDYKTILKKEFNENGLNREIINRGYHISAAMYQYGEFIRTGKWKPFYIIWLMKEPPYDLLIMDISEYCYEYIDGILVKNSGAILFESLKKQHELCYASGVWKGLSAKYENGICKAIPPRYVNADYEFFEVA